MYTRWTQHLTDPSDKEKFKNEVLGSKRVLERLSQMIDEDLQALDKSEFDHRSYDVANWSHLQAHRNVNRQVYATFKKLINLDQQKGTNDDRIASK